MKEGRRRLTKIRHEIRPMRQLAAKRLVQHLETQLPPILHPQSQCSTTFFPFSHSTSITSSSPLASTTAPQLRRHTPQQMLSKIPPRLFPPTIPNRNNLTMLHDIELPQPRLVERVGRGVDDVAEPVLFGEDEHGVEEGFHGRGGVD